MTFKVFSLQTIKDFKPEEGTLLIRIFDHNKMEYMKEHNPLNYKEDFKDILEYEFNDIDLSYNPLKLDQSIPNEHEMMFINAINQLKEDTEKSIKANNIKNIVIHCHMGERRSVATMFGLQNTLLNNRDNRISLKEMEKTLPDYNKYIYSLF